MDHEETIKVSIRPDGLKVQKNVLYKETNGGISMYNIDPEYLNKLFSQQDFEQEPEKVSENSDEESKPEKIIELELLTTLEVKNIEAFDMMDEVTIFAVVKRDFDHGASFFINKYKRIDT